MLWELLFSMMFSYCFHIAFKDVPTVSGWTTLLCETNEVCLTKNGRVQKSKSDLVMNTPPECVATPGESGYRRCPRTSVGGSSLEDHRWRVDATTAPPAPPAQARSQHHPHQDRCLHEDVGPVARHGDDKGVDVQSKTVERNCGWDKESAAAAAASNSKQKINNRNNINNNKENNKQKNKTESHP